jgi:ATP-dependent Clp protease ATP-binding subunit ClpA
VLLDEIEKAHPDVFNMLLQLLEDGRLTDNKGRTVSFDNTVVIMTSNAGAHLIPGPDEMCEREEEIRERLLRELQTYFRPEFLNRVDEVIVFHSLSYDDLRKIAALLLENLRHTAKGQDIGLRFSDAVIQRIAEEGRESRYGARPLRRAVGKLIESPLSKEIIAGRVKPEDTVYVDMDPAGHPSFKPTPSMAEQPAVMETT